MSGEQDNYGIEWARRKLDLPRRRRELELYLARWLPELDTMDRGMFLDVGCGCGDLLAIVRAKGFNVLGLDAPDGMGGMGDAFIALCRVIRMELNVPVVECRLLDWIELPDGHLAGNVAVINARGSVEQAFSDFMEGTPHDVDHRSDNKRWREAQDTVLAIRGMMKAFYSLLRQGGMLLVASNGSANNAWYNSVMILSAEVAGFRLVEQSDTLVYKWIKQ